VDLTQTEYMERLVSLLPDSTFIGKYKMAFGSDSLVHAAQMTEAISNEVFKVLLQFKETDLVSDLKDATRNLAVLGRFLTISYNTIFEANR
jgi:hypothetical protein